MSEVIKYLPYIFSPSYYSGKTMEEVFAKKKEDKQVKEEQKPEAVEEKKKAKFVHLLDEDQVEIKCLDEEDAEDALKIMQRCSFEVTEEEVEKVISYGTSFGCYVNRMLIGVGLGWPASYDNERKIIIGGGYNAVYLEEPAVLLMYEGRGIRRILLRARERAATSSKYKYTIAYLSEDIPKGNVVDYIKEGGTQLEKLYLSEDYEFFRTSKGVLAVKRLGE